MQLEAKSLGQVAKVEMLNENIIKHELLIKQLKTSNIDLENQVTMHQEQIKFVNCCTNHLSLNIYKTCSIK